MATFDQLPADQRAIIELVLKRGRSYEQLADMLQMPETRVRELARMALTDLSPITAKRVDDEWRDQVGDYALGQQSGPESAATKGHLRRSEPARVWLGSVIDSLEQLYNEDNMPELPEPDGGRARDRRGLRDVSAPAATTAAGDKNGDGKKAGEPLSSSARDAVQRRRFIIGGGIFAVLIAIAVVIALSSGGGSDNKDKSTAASAPDTSATTAQSNARLIGQLALKPIDPKNKSDVGIAQFASNGSEIEVGVQAKLPPNKKNQAYEVWLYNSQKDAISLGAQQVQSNGTFSGANKLPAGYEKYKYIDISLEPINQDKSHSGNSILRGALADIVTPQEQQQSQGNGGSGGTGTGTSTTP
jgi:hypothetical protein